jgi:hypothetical protein
MALVSRRLDDIHYATDTEGDGYASASEEAVPNPERSRGLSVKSLVQRTCRCSAKACFTQFNSAAGIATVLAARADYAALEKDMQDVYISLNCLRQDPFVRRDRSAPMPTGDAGTDVLLASDSEGGSEVVLYASESDDTIMHASESDDEHVERIGRRRHYRKRIGSKQRTCALDGRPVCQQA